MDWFYDLFLLCYGNYVLHKRFNDTFATFLCDYGAIYNTNLCDFDQEMNDYISLWVF